MQSKARIQKSRVWFLEALSSWGSLKQRAKTYKVNFIEKSIIYNLFKYTYGAYNSL